MMGGEIGQRGGESVVTQPVIGHSQREIRCQRGQFDLGAQQCDLDFVMAGSADDRGDAEVYRAQKILAVGGLDQPARAGAVDQPCASSEPR